MTDLIPKPDDSGERGGKQGGEAGYLVLPFDEEHFKTFVRGLLGRPQTIGRIIRGRFEIRVGDIANLNHLVSQRMSQQNAGVLAAFTARINYSDASTVEVTSVPELLTYNEIRPVWCRAIHLKWDYLVKFPDKEIPEKQSIQVSFVGGAGEGIPVFDTESILVIGGPFHAGPGGFISFRIEHTARTWGADIEALLSNHLQTLIQPESPYKRWVRKYSTKISLAIGVGFFALVLVGVFITTRRFAAGQVADVNAQLASGRATSSSMLMYLTKFVAGGSWSQYYFAVVVFLVFAIFASIWLGIWAENSANTTAPSFVLLTKESENEKVRVLERLRKKHRSFIWAVISSIGLGIISNIIFARFFS